MLLCKVDRQSSLASVRLTQRLCPLEYQCVKCYQEAHFRSGAAVQ